jgi:hypothetical protein
VCKVRPSMVNLFMLGYLLTFGVWMRSCGLGQGEQGKQTACSG